MTKEKIVLAYSGGLDTSVSVKWIQEKYGYDVIALGLDVGGEGKDLEAIKQKALNVGAIKAYMIDAKELLAKEYILPALKANCLYEGKYPLSSALIDRLFQNYSWKWLKKKEPLLLPMAVQEKEMIKFVLKFPFKH